MTRIFIALEMNAALQLYLSGVIKRLAPALTDLRWVDPQGIHLTLAFLGEVDQIELAKAQSAVERTAQQSSSFTYRLTSLNIFGTPRQPRVLRMGIDEPAGALTRLHDTLKRQLEQQGFPTEPRPFLPHLTLARGKAPLPSSEQAYLQALLSGKQEQFLSSATYSAAHLCVMKSKLTSAGAKYTCLQAISFSK